MLQIRLASIKCNEDTDESGDDRPYVLVASVAVPPHPPGSPIFFAGPCDVTLYSFGKMNSNTREFFGSEGNRFQSFWGVGALPSTLADTLNGICVVALMENDESDPSILRAFVLAAAQASLVRSISLPRGGKVTMLLADVDSARRVPTGVAGAFNPEDAIGAVQELSFTEKELQGADAGETVIKALQFVGDGGHYTLKFEAFNPAFEGSPPPPILFPTTTPSRQMGAMEAFRSRQPVAKSLGFVGGFPNFYLTPGPGGVGFLGGTIFLTHAAAEWRDVPLLDLGNVDLNNFEERMRQANLYARREGFVGGFPTYFHADHRDGKGIVCGTILIKEAAATLEEVSLSDLGNPALDDYERRFTGTQDYASSHDFLGGFPDLFHDKRLAISAGTGQPIVRTVCGAVLIRPSYIDFRTGRRHRAAEWRNV